MFERQKSAPIAHAIMLTYYVECPVLEQQEGMQEVMYERHGIGFVARAIQPSSTHSV